MFWWVIPCVFAWLCLESESVGLPPWLLSLPLALGSWVVEQMRYGVMALCVAGA